MDNKVKEIMDKIQEDIIEATKDFIGKPHNDNIDSLTYTLNYILIEGKLKL